MMRNDEAIPIEGDELREIITKDLKLVPSTTAPTKLNLDLSKINKDFLCSFYRCELDAMTDKILKDNKRWRDTGGEYPNELFRIEFIGHFPGDENEILQIKLSEILHNLWKKYIIVNTGQLYQPT